MFSNDLTRQTLACQGSPNNAWRVFELLQALAACGVAPEQLGHHVEVLVPDVADHVLGEALWEFEGSRDGVQASHLTARSLDRQAIGGFAQ